jgi:putative ABC transport system ATP-binding protein
MEHLVLDVRGVGRAYPRGRYSVDALRDVSLSLGPGRTVALMGPSGSGKTTLLNLLAGLDRPTSGEVWVDGTRLSDLDSEAATVFRRRNIGFVFQFFNLLPTMTARDNVALPLLADRAPRKEATERALAALERVGMVERASHRPSELSGGEMQRVAIARSLVMRPKLLLADEPTGNLDTHTGDEILRLLRQAVDEYGLSIVMVTHSYIAAAAMDRVLFIQDGAIVDEVDAANVSPPQAGGRHLHAVPPRPQPR